MTKKTEFHLLKKRKRKIHQIAIRMLQNPENLYEVEAVVLEEHFLEAEDEENIEVMIIDLHVVALDQKEVVDHLVQADGVTLSPRNEKSTTQVLTQVLTHHGNLRLRKVKNHSRT